MNDVHVRITGAVYSTKFFHVLILIVVDNGLVQDLTQKWRCRYGSLNPCCSGRWSRTAEKDSYQPGERVLILVVVEDGLVLSSPRMPPNRGNVLILVVVEDGLVLALH